MKIQKINSNLTSKIILLSLLFFFVGMTTTFAQKQGKKNLTPTERAEKKSKKWKTKFNLNDTQTAQIKTALEKRITEMGRVKGQGKSPEKKAQRKAIKTEFDGKVKSIFTDSQYADYLKMKEEKKGKKKGKGKKRQNLDDNNDF
mgnify:CR=1 FL=1